MRGTTWVVLVVTGVMCMWAMRYTQRALLDAVLIRASAAAYAGAGVVGASGWLGGLIAGVTGWVTATGQSLGAAALGSAAVWVVWLVLSLMWVATMLPERVFHRSIPDWLAFSGLVLPGLAASIPGPLGHGLHQVITTVGTAMVTGAGRALGVGA